MRAFFWRRFGLAIAAFLLAIAVALSAGTISAPVQFAQTQHPPDYRNASERGERKLSQTNSAFPPPQIHPLPSTLAQWQSSHSTGDYFDRVQITPVGYLVWSEFPVKVYLERPTETGDRNFQAWTNAILAAMKEWNAYLPLIAVEQLEDADIIWERSRPPFQATLNRETRQLEIPTARSGEARYELYIRPGNPSTLAHRFTLQLSPHQTSDLLLSTARHELGHALGIWGHSSSPSDALYSSPLANASPISSQDIATLKQIYQQPTRLGWPIPTEPQPMGAISASPRLGEKTR